MKRFVFFVTVMTLGAAGLCAQSRDQAKEQAKQKQKSEAVIALDDDDDAADLLAGLELQFLSEWQDVPAPPAPTPPPDIRVFQFGHDTSRGSYLGIGVAEIDAERARALKLSEERGVEITRVTEGSPAAEAGLKQNDVVLEFNGVRVEGVEQFGRLVREVPPGRKVKLLISRDGQMQTVAATAGDRHEVNREWQAKLRQDMKEMQDRLRSQHFEFRMPDMPDIPNVFMTYRSGHLGIEAERLTPQLAEFFGVKKGVLVRSVNKDSPAEKAGIKAGDVITKVEGEEVSSPNEITLKLAGIERTKKGTNNVPFTVVRNRAEMTVQIAVEGRSDLGEYGPRRIATPSIQVRPIRPVRPVVAPEPARVQM